MATGPEVAGPVNLGNPTEVTIRALAEMTLAKAGGGTLVAAPLPGDDPRQRRPDISLARTLLGWEPAVGLDEGLDRTIAYFRKVLPQLAPV